MQTLNIQEQIKKLIALQAIDAQIYSLRREQESKPVILQKLQEAFDAQKNKLAELAETSKRLQLKRKDKEGELAVKEENIKKTQTQLYQLKTNKEFAAMLKDIEGLKADKSVIEDDIIKLLDEADKLNAEIDEEKKRLTQEEAKLNQEKSVITSRLTEIQASLESLNTQRKAATDGIEKRTLTIYERVLKNREGLAIVPVKNGACQGCFMNVPPQVINEIRMLDKLIICEMCARILYLEEFL